MADARFLLSRYHAEVCFKISIVDFQVLSLTTLLHSFSSPLFIPSHSAVVLWTAQSTEAEYEYNLGI